MSEHAISTTLYEVVEHEDYKTGHLVAVKTEGDTVFYKLGLKHSGQVVKLGSREDAERILALLECALSPPTRRQEER